MVAIIATGGAVVILSPYRNEIVFGVMGCLVLSYGFFFCYRKKNLTLNSAEKCLLVFILIGLLHVILSQLEISQRLWDLDLYFDKSYLLRQAVYLFVLPAILLFQDDFYTRGKDYLIHHYGELLFWVLLIYEYFHAGKEIQVSAQLLLGWLALRVKSPQPWRNWARYIAVLFAPLPFDGSSTVLVFRFLFALILIIPVGRSRLLQKWVAIGLLVVLIAVSFVAPLVLSDTSFISDYNTKWRINYWIDEMNNLGHTYGLGVGYGTSYPSKTFASDPDLARYNFFGYDRFFTVACHNSFVAVAMRTGIFGIAAFMMFIFLMLREMLKYRILASKAAFFALLGAVVCIAFNVGLESPNYMFSFIFCLGECNQEVWRIRRESRLAGKITESVGGEQP